MAADGSYFHGELIYTCARRCLGGWLLSPGLYVWLRHVCRTGRVVEQGGGVDLTPRLSVGGAPVQ